MNIKRMLWGFVFLVFACFCVVAQEKPQILISLAESGQIEIIQSEQVENMLKMQIANNRQQEGIPGFRIQIHSRAGRSEADQVRADFMRRFPEMNAITRWNAPNFQVFVGDFRTKTDALRELKRIERVYPRSFWVPDIINISN